MRSRSSGAFDGRPPQYEGEPRIILVKVPALVKDLGGEVAVRIATVHNNVSEIFALDDPMEGYDTVA